MPITVVSKDNHKEKVQENTDNATQNAIPVEDLNPKQNGREIGANPSLFFSGSAPRSLRTSHQLKISIKRGETAANTVTQVPTMTRA